VRPRRAMRPITSPAVRRWRPRWGPASFAAMKTRILAPAVFGLVLAVAMSLAHAQQMIPAPPDVSAPPADAVVTASGLASKVLEEGGGTRHPKATDMVEVNYTGWTTDGKMFDSSIVRGQTATFPLSGVIAGWTEGVQLMVEGEKRRFWIPEDLAYRGTPGYPAGMLVFDVELIRINP
jgi:hypothetical protein